MQVQIKSQQSLGDHPRRAANQFLNGVDHPGMSTRRNVLQ
jgi:hypothetical protein